MMANRDVAREFKWERLHREAASTLLREFDHGDAGSSQDFCEAFSVLPFGLAGNPGYFCRFADVVQAIHQSYGPADLAWST